MKEETETQKKALRRFHAVCRSAGLSENEKRAIIEGCRVTSSKDIPEQELIAICNNISKLSATNMDKLRKQVIASIGGWLKKVEYNSNIDLIKGIACRATGYDNFNKIPAERLRNVYNTFLNKQKDATSISAITDSMLLKSVTHQNNTIIN